MNNFEDWLMSLPTQTLTDELKIEILSEVNAMINEEVVNILRNITTK